MRLTNKLIPPVTGVYPLAVSVEDFKKHIKWDPADNSENTLMQSYIMTATKQAEFFTGRVITLSTWYTLIDSFRNVTLDMNPVAIPVVVKYYDADNTLQTLDAAEYTVKDFGPDSYIEIDFDGTIPSVYDRYDAVIIELTAGYTDIPEPIKNWIMDEAAMYFNNRGNNEYQKAISLERYAKIWPYKML